jgi:hypothetical protein
MVCEEVESISPVGGSIVIKDFFVSGGRAGCLEPGFAMFLDYHGVTEIFIDGIIGVAAKR